MVAKQEGTNKLAELFAQDHMYLDSDSDANQLLNFTGNHDMGRFAHILKNSEHNYNEFEIILQLANDLITKNKSKLYFVFIPHNNRFSSKNEYDNSNYFSIKKIVRNLNITFIDLKDILEKKDNPMKYYPFGMDGHFSEVGYRDITNIIYNYIEK